MGKKPASKQEQSVSSPNTVTAMQQQYTTSQILRGLRRDWHEATLKSGLSTAVWSAQTPTSFW
jgi:hypothetical protein